MKANMVFRFLFSVLIVSMLSISLVHAVVYLDSVKVCYEFNGDELISRDVCILSAQSGAGGGSFDLMYKGENHHFDYTEGEPMNSYYRYPSLDRVENEDEFFEINTEHLVCFSHQPYDMCYAHSRDLE